MNEFDITEIEDEIIEVVRSLNISKKVLANRPKAMEQASDFIVVKVSGGVDDRAAFGECTVSIHLFAKDNDNIKNGKKLSMMYMGLVKGLPASSGRLLFSTTPKIIGDTPDDFGYHARIIRIHTTIKI